jgi:hypothetical protein
MKCALIKVLAEYTDIFHFQHVAGVNLLIELPKKSASILGDGFDVRSLRSITIRR